MFEKQSLTFHKNKLHLLYFYLTFYQIYGEVNESLLSSKLVSSQLSAQSFFNKSKLQVQIQDKVTSPIPFPPPNALQTFGTSPFARQPFLPRYISQSLDVPFPNKFLYCYRVI